MTEQLPLDASALDQALDEADGGTVTVAGPGWQAQVDTRKVGPVGAVVDRVRVNGCDGDVVQRTKAVVERLRPHGERLVPIEVDATLGGAVIRTRPEDMRGGRYFEVGIERDAIEVTRHRRKAEGGRVREPFQVTREELGRVLDGLGEVVAAPEPSED